MIKKINPKYEKRIIELSKKLWNGTISEFEWKLEIAKLTQEG